MLDLLLTDRVTKMKLGGNSVEDHSQLSHNRHPVDGALVGAGSLWPCLLSQSEAAIAPEPQGGGFCVLLLIYYTFAKAWEYLSSTEHQNRIWMKECTPGYICGSFQ
jgi:hypothetical protein